MPIGHLMASVRALDAIRLVQAGPQPLPQQSDPYGAAAPPAPRLVSVTVPRMHMSNEPVQVEVDGECEEGDGGTGRAMCASDEAWGDVWWVGGVEEEGW